MHEPSIITGMSRSGTSLLVKLLDEHPEISGLNQPFPYIYRYVKNEFIFKKTGQRDQYPLGSLFKETRYSVEQFEDFLKNERITPETLKRLQDAMVGWSGQYTKSSTQKMLAEIGDQPLGLFDVLIHTGAASSVKKRVVIKETLIEEFLAALLNQGSKAILILRDPRSVLRSIISEDGRKYTGVRRPTLWHIRAWRKSVAIRNTLEGREGFLSLFYEDLIQSPKNELEKIEDLLAVGKFPSTATPSIVNADDRGIPLNSSLSTRQDMAFDRDRAQAALSQTILPYVEYMCAPEMRSLGYDLMFPESCEPPEFEEPYVIEADDLPTMLSTSADELSAEKRRRWMLCAEKELRKSEVLAYFHSERNFTSLRAAYNLNGKDRDR